MSYYYNIAFYWNDIEDNRINEFKQYLKELYPHQFENKNLKICCFNNFNTELVEFYLKPDDMNILYHFSIDRNSNIELIR
jgi:hypothetical protein